MTKKKIETIKKIHEDSFTYSRTRKGAPKPASVSPFWNEWAANNPQPEAKALKALDPSDALVLGIKGITTGARPVNHVY